PSWSAESVTIVADITVAATVTNTITEDVVVPAVGAFSVTKALVNADGVTGVPAEYTVEYSLDGGATWVQLLVAAGATVTVGHGRGRHRGKGDGDEYDHGGHGCSGCWFVLGDEGIGER